jgi:hypothetical protein
MGYEQGQADNVGDEHEHVPGLVFAPVFGLPGQRSSVCETCGASIVKRHAGAEWVRA